MKTEEENKENNLKLKDVSKQDDAFGIHSFDNFREVGNYTWVAEEIIEEMGFPDCVKDTDDCHYCEGQLFVMRHGTEETNQSTDTFGQVLTMINHETGNVNIFIRSLNPLLNGEEWSAWQMVATGDTKLITENNGINAELTALREQIENDNKRIDVTEASLLERATVRFDRIEEDEATINAGEIDSTPTAIVYYKPANVFVAADSAGNYYDTWEGINAYMEGTTIRKDKIYLYGDEVYIWMNESLQSAIGRTLTDNFINAKKETVTLSLNKGYIRFDSGAIETVTTSYSHSEPIFIPKGTLIRLSSVEAASSVAVISQYNGTYKPLVQGNGATPKDYSYYISSDANIVFSGITATLSNISLISSEVISDILDKTEINANVVNNIISTPFVNSGFININNGALVESASYSCTDYILVSDDTYIKTNISGSAASVAFYDSNKKFISALSNTEINFSETDIPNNAVYFRSSCRSTYSGVMFTSIVSLLSLIGNKDETIKSLAQNVITNGMRYALPQDYEGYLAADCSVTESTAYKHTDYINIKGVKSLTIPSGAISGAAVSILFDEEKNKVLEIASSMAGTAIEVPGNVAYGRFTFNKNNATAYIVINEFDKSAVSIKQTADYKPQKSVLFESGVNILSAEMFNISGFLLADGELNTDTTTYKATDYIRIAQGSYNYSGRVTGSACVHIYNKKKDIIKTITNTDTISTFTVPNNGHYIRLSSTDVNVTLEPTTTIYSHSTEILSTADRVLTDFSNSDGVYTLNCGAMECNTFRVQSKFKFTGYTETVGDFLIADFGGKARLYLQGAANTMKTYTSHTANSLLPIPTRNSRYKLTVGNSTYYSDGISLPNYKELIGKDAFRIKYVGGASQFAVDSTDVQEEFAALADSLLLNFVNGRLTIKSDTTTYIDEEFSDVASVGEMVTYLQEALPAFDVQLLGNSFMPVSELAPINEVCLVTEYLTTNVVTDAKRYDAFYCYFNEKFNDDEHIMECICEEGSLQVVVDGIRMAKRGVDVSNVRYVKLGSNGACPVVVNDAFVNIGHTADAEYTEDGKIISEALPSIVVLMGHGMWAGDECDGLFPLYIGMTPSNSKYKAVIPVEFATKIGDGLLSDGSYTTTLANIAMSDKRFERICDLAKRKGYTHIKLDELSKLNTGELPKRCWALCFDDRNQYFFEDLTIRNVFGRTGVNPTFATSYSTSDIGSESYVERQRKIDRAGWETVMHGLRDINVSTMTSQELYDISSTDNSKWKMFNVQRTTAENVDIDWSVWVYSNGSCNPNTIKAFEHLGVKAAVEIDTGKEVCRGMNKYYIRRLNASDKTPFKNIEMLFE